MLALNLIHVRKGAPAYSVVQQIMTILDNTAPQNIERDIIYSGHHNSIASDDKTWMRGDSTLRHLSGWGWDGEINFL